MDEKNADNVPLFTRKGVQRRRSQLAAPSDVIRVLGRCVRQVERGKISPAAGAAMIAGLRALLVAFAAEDNGQRIAAIEESIASIKAERMAAEERQQETEARNRLREFERKLGASREIQDPEP